LNEPETNPLQCPFCGAPQRRFMPKEDTEAKCQYCGGVFQVNFKLDEKANRCPNHPEKLSDGLCNDCGQSFCTECLLNYEVTTREGSDAVLFLCSNCFKRRHLNKANGDIYGGLFAFVIGLVCALLAFWVGVFFMLIGLGGIIWDFGKEVRRPES
jgi:hypothetical protein